MDWLTVLLFVIFFGLPLLQQLLEKSRNQQLPPPEGELYDEEGEAFEPREVTGQAARRRRVEQEQPSTAASGGWSTDWGSWPAPGEETEVEPEHHVAYDVPVLLDEVPVPVPVRPPPPLPVEIEVIRVPDVVQAPQGSEGLAAVRQARRQRATAQTVPVRGPSISSRLADPAELRNAIIMNEVLGPPVSLRSYDGTRVPSGSGSR